VNTQFPAAFITLFVEASFSAFFNAELMHALVSRTVTVPQAFSSEPTPFFSVYKTPETNYMVTVAYYGSPTLTPPDTDFHG
jgi:hypothetical protein